MIKPEIPLALDGGMNGVGVIIINRDENAAINIMNVGLSMV